MSSVCSSPTLFADSDRASPVSSSAPKQALIVGAGPSGILTAVHLLKRGWKVTLVEKDVNLLDIQDYERKKSWMIGISKTGQDALSTVPSLASVVQQSYIETETASMYFMGRFHEMKMKVGAVDRNLFVTALTKELLCMEDAADLLEALFETKVLHIDGHKRSVLVESVTGERRDIPYDLLVGADGARSVVRSSLFSQSPYFRCSSCSIFNTLKSVYIEAPAQIKAGQFYFLVGILDGAHVMLAPTPKGGFNFIASSNDNLILPEDLISDDADVVCRYLNTKFAKLFPISRDVCQKFVEASWHISQQVQCGPYHMDVHHGAAVLIGDAAHATSPGQGMGLNTALADSVFLVDLLDKYGSDDLDTVLSEYSKARVKVGNALTDLSMHNVPFTTGRSFYTFFAAIIRTMANKVTFGWVDPPIRDMFPRGVPIDEIYRKAMKQGFSGIMWANEKIVQENFYQSIGLLPRTKSSAIAADQRSRMTASDVRKLRKVRDSE